MRLWTLGPVLGLVLEWRPRGLPGHGPGKESAGSSQPAVPGWALAQGQRVQCQTLGLAFSLPPQLPVDSQSVHGVCCALLASLALLSLFLVPYRMRCVLSILPPPCFVWSPAPARGCHGLRPGQTVLGQTSYALNSTHIDLGTSTGELQ